MFNNLINKNSLKIKNLKLKIFLLSLIILGGFLRFYNLNWGAPFYFHPDERNIASAVSQLSFPREMNPHFFAYGSLPIYIIYVTGLLANIASSCSSTIFNNIGCSVSFSQAIIISRIYSALLSMGIIFLLYLVGKKIKDINTGILAALLGTISVGFIQFSHFGTFEMWLSFLSLLLLYVCLKLIEKIRIQILLAGFIFGILSTVKVSSLAIFPLIIFSILFHELIKKKKINIAIFSTLKYVFLSLIIAFATFLFFSPFAILGFSSFFASLRYESGVATGILPVFYTQSFVNTIPVIFQFTKVYPFLINPLLTIIFVPSIFYVLYISIRKNVPSYYLLLISYFLLFFSQAFFFAKWTRYMVPTLPFIYLIIAITIIDFLTKTKRNFRYVTFISIFFVSAVFTLSYFATVLLKPDTRISASLWAKENIPNNSKILSETYDLGIIPFNQYFSNITLFNFYDLDNNPLQQQLFSNTFTAHEYFIIPSQRILENRILKKEFYPQGYKFYISLINGTSGYKKVYETPCDILCKITYTGDPLFSLEETTSVFDRPTVIIFKKQ